MSEIEAAIRRIVREELERVRSEQGSGSPGQGCDPPPRCDRGGFIYFIQAEADGLPTKIGVALDITKRMRTIRGCCPHNVRLIAFYWHEAPYAEEAALHQEFAPHRLRGEWFAWNDALASYVADANLFTVLHTPCDGGLTGALSSAIGEDEEELPP